MKEYFSSKSTKPEDVRSISSKVLDSVKGNLEDNDDDDNDV